MSFTPLSYIESSGTQYIDTGVAPTASTMAVLRYCFTGITNFADVLLGCRNAAGDMSSRFYPASLNGSALDERCVLGTTTLLHSHAEQAVHLVTFNDENHAVLLDGAQLGTLPVSGFTPPGRSMYLFSGRNTDGPDWFAVARLYDCRITDTSTGTLLRHFRPALDEHGVACLWDTVTERYFYNAGTGDFTWAAAPPDFDKKQFLAGLAVGRQLKGWATLHYELPTHIEVLTAPTLREYANGAALDFTGLEVVLRKDDGGRYTDRNYPDGVVPMSELTCPVTRAHFDGTGGQGAGEFYVGDTLAFRSLYCEERNMSYADYQANNLHDPVAKLFKEGEGYGEWFIFWDHTPFRVAYLGGGHFLLAAACDHQICNFGEKATRFTISWYTANSTYSQMTKYTYDGKTVYYLDFSYYSEYLVEPYLEASEVVNAGAAAWAMIYGGLGEKQSIPVDWTAPLTKFPALPAMRDTFSIFVHENEE